MGKNRGRIKGWIVHSSHRKQLQGSQFGDREGDIVNNYHSIRRRQFILPSGLFNSSLDFFGVLNCGWAAAGRV